MDERTCDLIYKKLNQAGVLFWDLKQQGGDGAMVREGVTLLNEIRKLLIKMEQEDAIGKYK